MPFEILHYRSWLERPAAGTTKILALFSAIVSVVLAWIFFQRFDKFEAEVENPQPTGGKIWVLLVAGSSRWDNYRHQVR